MLANDTDPDGGPKTIDSVTAARQRHAWSITGGGTGLTYQPDADYCNTRRASPTLHLHADTGGSTATVAITVTCVDDPPIAVDDAATVAEDSGATAIDVLANDTDADGGDEDDRLGDPAGQRHGRDHRRRHRPHLHARTPTTATTRRPDRRLHLHPERRLDGDGGGDGHLRRRHPVAVNDTATVAEDSGATAIDVLGQRHRHRRRPEDDRLGDPAGQRHAW